MSFGYLYDFRNPVQWRKPWAEFYAETLDLMVRTEQLGFEGVWVPEHHDSDDGYLPSPLTVLGAVAARTKTVKLGTAIALAPLYHPVRFAEDCAVLDILSKGRLEMAVAVGYRRLETDAFGVPFNSRGTRTDEFIQIVRRLWAGETVSHESKHFSIKNARIQPGPLSGSVPLYVGGFSQKAMQRAVMLGDGYHGNVEMFDAYLKTVTACGKDPAKARLRGLDLLLYVAKDTKKAFEELAPHCYYTHQAYSKWMNEDAQGYDITDVTLKSMSFEEFKASGTLKVLTPEQAIGYFNGLLDRHPIEHFMLFVPSGFPPDRFAGYAEVFAREVIPAFQ
jgi:alkanesulfonate monooxygenase SsuD/methylene tetrahydromethanopterin reductase-like flavin-dependent oxidoreductase (luciferase family)